MKTLNDLLARIPEMQAKAKQRAEQERHLHTKRGGVRVFKSADVAIRALHECSYVGPLVVVMKPEGRRRGRRRFGEQIPCRSLRRGRKSAWRGR